MARIIYSGTPESLPYTFDYVPDQDSSLILSLTGSVWSSNPHCKIGLKVVVGSTEAVTASIWSNGASTHRSVNQGLAPYAFPIVIENGNIKPVSITIDKLNSNSIFDVNDSVTLAIL